MKHKLCSTCATEYEIYQITIYTLTSVRNNRMRFIEKFISEGKHPSCAAEEYKNILKNYEQNFKYAHKALERCLRENGD